MYLGFSSSANTVEPSTKSTEPTNRPIYEVSQPKQPQSVHYIPQKIYLRVADMTGEVFKKAKNIVDIFNEGSVKVIFYDSSTSKYSEYSEKMFYSEYAINELKKLIGSDNVVLK